jgi:hypothetical protein
METINLIASVATLLTAVATFLTVWEMRMQRRSSFAPKLAIDDTALQAREHRTGSLALCSPACPPEEQHGYARFNSLVTNIGLGPALDVKVEWSYDIDEFVAIIARLDDDKVFEIEISELFLSVKSPTGRVRGASYHLPVEKHDVTKRLLPLNSSSSQWAVSLPGSYLLLCLLWVLLEYERMRRIGGKTYIFSTIAPTLTGHFSYRDVAGNTHDERFEFQISPFSCREEPDESPNFRVAELKVEVTGI